jgi:hypothetical protein
MMTLEKRRNFLFYALLAFCLVLPVVQGLKNIAAGVLLIAFVLNLPDLRQRMSGPVFYSGLLFLLSGLISVLINSPAPGLWAGMKDSLMIPLLMWLGCFGGFSEDRKKKLFLALLVSCLVALVWGYYDFHIGKKPFLELHGAGVVTQCSVYLGMIIVAHFGYLVTQWERLQGRVRYLHIAVFLFLLASLFLMGSRSGLLGSIGAFAILAVVWLRNKKNIAWLALAFSVLMAVLYVTPDYFGQHRLFTKIEEQVTTRRLDLNDAYRMYHWQTAYNFFWKADKKLFGIGPNQFHTIEATQYATPPDIVKQGGVDIHQLSGAHNLFLNKLVGEGLFGLGAMLFMFLVVAVQLYRQQDKRTWLWAVGLAGLVVPVIGSSFNAPFFQEYGWLAGLMFGLCCSQAVKRETV